MASASPISMALPLTGATTQRKMLGSQALFKPLPVKPSTAMAAKRSNARLVEVKASSSSSFSERVVSGLTAAALTTSMVIPEVAQAADGVTPSLKNFLLSIAAGGVVAVAIIGPVIGLSNFDPASGAEPLILFPFMYLFDMFPAIKFHLFSVFDMYRTRHHVFNLKF
ncbi:SNF7 family protein [Hibiscus syriacus]|uniref:SNF7 family protein n=1 Tax=Hibiscus syriacus TaxID=106335 RepID=A0A6A3D7T7_HIBSY|nr:SNF7 family protein [Hibiscus syriacus]